MRHETATSCLTPAAQADVKIDFYKYRDVFGKFHASKADHRKVKGASKDLAATQAYKATISSYFMMTATQKAN
ncbi:hypothetical protein BGX38DRAFT_1276777 [Terfezia claveryi]|nr:hypothetical protein BGX38DRAFT_1276777 [Terfezia claveryi]